MNELIAKVKELAAELVADAELQAEKGNKAAGTRARKASLTLEKVLKEFRKNSIGKALLNKCLWDIKLRGDSIAIIKNAGPIEFYEKCCNANII